MEDVHDQSHRGVVAGFWRGVMQREYLVAHGRRVENARFLPTDPLWRADRVSTEIVGGLDPAAAAIRRSLYDFSIFLALFTLARPIAEITVFAAVISLCAGLASALACGHATLAADIGGPAATADLRRIAYAALATAAVVATLFAGAVGLAISNAEAVGARQAGSAHAALATAAVVATLFAGAVEPA